jgi:site-specific DNA-methyltransferase (adenine-specific)
MNINSLYNENCLDTMARMPDNFIDLTVTSPPYDNLRTYNNEIDKTWNEDVWKSIIKELYRVTKEGGTVVWVVGDATINGSETGTSFRQALYFVECGFNLHDTMIYQKHNFSNPSNNRYHQIFEYMFILSKGTPITFNPIKDRKNIYYGKSCWGKNIVRQKDGSFKERQKNINSEYGMRFNIWKYTTEMKPLHPAQFPKQLAKDHILSWSNENDLVYDPFMGSGTTAKASIELKRNWIGSEISEEYCEIIQKRISSIQVELL